MAMAVAASHPIPSRSPSPITHALPTVPPPLPFGCRNAVPVGQHLQPVLPVLAGPPAYCPLSTVAMCRFSRRLTAGCSHCPPVAPSSVCQPTTHLLQFCSRVMCPACEPVRSLFSAMFFLDRQSLVCSYISSCVSTKYVSVKYDRWVHHKPPG